MRMGCSSRIDSKMVRRKIQIKHFWHNQIVSIGKIQDPEVTLEDAFKWFLN